jgi:2-polyprenyl-6-methoxyphenol hydroxylase-like FAD-dependent oxidoreductase
LALERVGIRAVIFEATESSLDSTGRAIIAATQQIERTALSTLPTPARRHRGRTCLVGDAAHAMPPHAGQGAAVALEDAVVIAKSLRDAPSPEGAFAAFQSARRGRVEHVIRLARRNRPRKPPPNAVARWIRDRALPVAIRAQARAVLSTYEYPPAWNDAATSPGREAPHGD